MDEDQASLQSDANAIVKSVQEPATKISLDNTATKLYAGNDPSITSDAVGTINIEMVPMSISNRTSLTNTSIAINKEGSNLETAMHKTDKSTEQDLVDITALLEEEKKIHAPHETETKVVANAMTEDTATLQSQSSDTTTCLQDLWMDDLKFPENDEEIQRAMNLFSMVMDSQRIKLMKFSSMLISGFGLRNYPSLCKALEYQYKLDQEYKRRKHKEEEEELARIKKYREIERQNRGEYIGETATTYSDLGSQTDFSTISASTHQNTAAEQRRRIEYLMGLHTTVGGWEEDAEMSSRTSRISELKDDESKSCGPEKEEPLTGSSDAMRQAQQYLRTHHIFEFFQFLIVHLLSRVPENPIDYLLLLLDKVLIYRSGLGEAPLHYKMRHLEQLFYLMDRMRTGFITTQQYKTGMNTIGIKCFNSKPPLNEDEQVPKEFFLQEALQCSRHVLDNIIRVRKTDRGMRKKYKPV